MSAKGIEIVQVYQYDYYIGSCIACSGPDVDIISKYSRRKSDTRVGVSIGAIVYSVRCCECGCTGPQAYTVGEAIEKYQQLLRLPS